MGASLFGREISSVLISSSIAYSNSTGKWGIQRVLCSAIVTVLLLLPCLLAAQSYRGSIRGQMGGPRETVIPNAKVAVRGTANGQRRETLTGPDGVYVVAELPA